MIQVVLQAVLSQLIIPFLPVHLHYSFKSLNSDVLILHWAFSETNVEHLHEPM